MGKRSTVLMIFLTTVVALGLTVYGEKLESNNIKQPSVVEKGTLSNYKNIQSQLRD